MGTVRKVLGARKILKEHSRNAIIASNEGKSKADVYHAAAGFAHPILELFDVKVEISNLDNLVEGPGIIVSNHTSFMDLIAMASFEGRKYFAAKKELYNNLFIGKTFGQGLKVVGLPEIDRSNPRTALKNLEDAVNMIKRENELYTGQSAKDSAYLGIFPEGTRSSSYELQEFKKTAFKLSVNHNIPIIPMAIYGAIEIMPKGSLRINPGIISINVCEPIYKEDVTQGLEMSSARIVNGVRDLAKTRIQAGLKVMKDYAT